MTTLLPQERRQAWGFAVAACALFVLMYTMHMGYVGAMAGAHYAFNYTYGIIKRGLVGQLFQWVVGAGSTSAIKHYAMGMLALQLVFLVWAGFQVCLKNSRMALFLLPYFLSASVMVHLCFFGFLDHTLVVLVLLVSVCPVRSMGLVSMAGLCIAGVLVHEMFAALVLPVLALKYYLHACAGGSSRQLRALAGITLICVVLCAGIVEYGVLPYEIVQRMYEEASARDKQPMRETAFRVLSRDAADNFSRTTFFWFDHLEARGGWRQLLSILPVGIFYAWLTFRLLRASRGSSLLASCLLAAISLASPLCLSLIGSDFDRFAALSGTVAFVNFMMAARMLPVAQERSWLPRSEWIVLLFFAPSLYTVCI